MGKQMTNCWYTLMHRPEQIQHKRKLLYTEKYGQNLCQKLSMQAAPCLLYPPTVLNATSLQQSTEKQHTYSCSRQLAALARLEEFKPTQTLCFKSNTSVSGKWHTEFSVLVLVRPCYPHLACIDLVSLPASWIPCSMPYLAFWSLQPFGYQSALLT